MDHVAAAPANEGFLPAADDAFGLVLGLDFGLGFELPPLPATTAAPAPAATAAAAALDLDTVAAPPTLDDATLAFFIAGLADEDTTDPPLADNGVGEVPSATTNALPPPPPSPSLLSRVVATSAISRFPGPFLIDSCGGSGFAACNETADSTNRVGFDARRRCGSVVTGRSPTPAQL
jgi:hypothetical protein